MTGAAAGRRRVAVIGAGVAGLTAGYVLRASHDVTLFEAESRLGGHAHTHDVTDPAGDLLAVDTGFIVHNGSTYPTLLRLFDELGVVTRETDMSMSVHCDGCGLEYAGGQGLGGIVARSRFLARPAFVRMLLEVTRFHRAARRLLASPGDDDTTLADFLAAGRYSGYFRAHFVTPLVAAVWSSSPATALEYPARYLFAFLANHGMLSVGGSLRWRTVVGGSRTYVERAAKDLHEVRTGVGVTAVTRRPDGVLVGDTDGGRQVFDQVLIATHPDQALALLTDPTRAEHDVLSAFRYTPNPAVLHTDASVLPAAPRARASWNYRMASCAASAYAVQVSYDLSRLQGLGGSRRYLASLNADVPDDAVLARMDYAHPAFSPASVAAQKLLPGLNDGVTAYAGAYHGWGFHEDGARSGLAAAQSLGGRW